MEWFLFCFHLYLLCPVSAVFMIIDKDNQCQLPLEWWAYCHENDESYLDYSNSSQHQIQTSTSRSPLGPRVIPSNEYHHIEMGQLLFDNIVMCSATDGAHPQKSNQTPLFICHKSYCSHCMIPKSCWFYGRGEKLLELQKVGFFIYFEVEMWMDGKAEWRIELMNEHRDDWWQHFPLLFSLIFTFFKLTELNALV